jgi:hypothetical protein
MRLDLPAASTSPSMTVWLVFSTALAIP